MVHIIRLCLAFYALVNAIRIVASWSYRNLPADRGGTYNNPFNNPHLFCCIYNKEPCPARNSVICARPLDDTHADPNPIVTPAYVRLVTPTRWDILAWGAVYLIAALCFFYDKVLDRDSGRGVGVIVGALFIIISVYLKPGVTPLPDTL